MIIELFPNGEVIINDTKIIEQKLSVSEIIEIVKNNAGIMFGTYNYLDGAVFKIELHKDDRIYVSFGNRFLMIKDNNKKAHALWSMIYKNHCKPLYIGRATREEKYKILSEIYWKALVIEISEMEEK